jgi:uncharacterized protein
MLDTAPLVAQSERNNPERLAARRVLLDERQPLVLSPLIAAEVDYFLQVRGRRSGNAGFIRDLAAGRYEVPCLVPGDFALMAELNEQYADLGAGLADLSIVVLAQRYKTTRILTLDQRHFRTLKPLQGGSFTLLPFDDDTDS